MERRLVSRCCGLVEALDHTEQHGHRTVAFIHKSVADFLRLPDIWEYIIDLTKDETSDINFVLARSRALHMKIMWPKPSKRAFSSGLEANTGYCLKYLRDGESRANRTSLRALQDLSLFTGLWARTSDDCIHSQAVSTTLNSSTGGYPLLTPLVVLDPLSDTHAELHLAACAGLQLHFKSMHMKQNCKGPKAGPSASEVDNQLLRILVEENRLKIAWAESYLNEQLEIIRFLIQNGSNPNWKPASAVSSWELLLQNLGHYKWSTADDKPLLDLDGKNRPSNERVSGCIDLIPIFLHSCCQSEDARIAKHSARMKKDALRCIEKIIKRTSLADGQLYLKAIQTRKMLLESSEETKTKSRIREKGLFGRIFSRVTRQSCDQQSLLPVKGKLRRSTI